VVSKRELFGLILIFVGGLLVGIYAENVVAIIGALIAVVGATIATGASLTD